VREAELVACLRDLDRPATPSVMHHIASLALLACRDRAVERDFFIGVLQLTEEMSDDAAVMDRTATLGRCVEALDKRRQLDLPEDDARDLPKVLQRKFDETHVMFTRRRLALADLIEMLLQCPARHDKVS
jgi:hypothetical protein